MSASAEKTGSDKPLALVTGGAAGIGRAIVLRLLDTGHRVVALDRDAAALEAFSSTARVIPFPFDLSDLNGTPAALRSLIEQHGPVRKLALNAGVWPGAPLIEMPVETFLLNIHINLVSPFLFMQTLVGAMRDAGGGAIAITASRNAFRSSTNNAGYDASKGGVVSLMRTAAGEFAEFNIRVNAVCPGVTTTPGNADAEDPAFKQPYCQQIPMGRYGEADEIAAVVAFLLADESSFVTGQTIIADGGQIACQDNARFMQISHMKADS
jgi:meso-butanediol dehydrogenase/(S,S)-butanediol dehydrogenase/diacetyl reductase